VIGCRSVSRLLAFLCIWLGIASVALTESAVAQATPDATPSVPDLVIASGCETVRPTGNLLLQPVVPSGVQQSGLIVVDPASGAETGRIDVPPVTAVFPTALPDRAVAVAGGDLLLIDADNLTATWIQLDQPATDLSPNPVQFRGSAGNRYMLLGSPSFDLTVLVDVQEGRATNLTALVVPPTPDAAVFIPFAAVTPDDAHVVMWDGQHVYVVDTTNPEGARRIDTGAFAFAPDFSPDAQSVIFSQSDGPGSGSKLVLEAIDGSASAVIDSSEHALVTLWVPRSRMVLVDERTEAGAATGSVYLLDIESGRETPLLQYEGSLSTVQFDPDGAHALLGTEQMGSTSWHLVDLASGAIEELPQIEGSRVSPGLYADSRWAIAAPSAQSNDPITGPAFRSIDLETGVIGRLLEQPDGVTFNPPQLSLDGHLSLVTGQSTTGATLWLLDAAELAAHPVADGTSVSALFAPNACQVAVSAESSIDGIPGTISSILPLDGKPAEEIGSGRVIGWTAGSESPRRDPSDGPVGFAAPGG
jgi:Tol biopolymer transport system component